jgi:hypothetical protein
MAATDVSPIHVPYPETTDRELKITADACQLHIHPGAGEAWVSGTYQDPSGQRSPKLTRDGGTLTIDHHRTTRDVIGELVAGDPRFDLRLGTEHPYALTIQAAAIQSEAELGGLPITRLAIRQRAGQSRFNFGEANPQPAEVLQLSSQGAAVEARNLANANAAAISLEGEAANYRLDFGGALQRSVHVQISTRASSVELSVPPSTPARIASASLLSDLEVAEGFTSQEGAFWTPAAAAADRPLLTIDASVEVGQLKLRLIEDSSGPRTQ